MVDIIEKYSSYELPIDTIWSDIDYMLKYEDFTINEEKFNKV